MFFVFHFFWSEWIIIMNHYFYYYYYQHHYYMTILYGFIFWMLILDIHVCYSKIHAPSLALAKFRILRAVTSVWCSPCEVLQWYYDSVRLLAWPKEQRFNDPDVKSWKSLLAVWAFVGFQSWRRWRIRDSHQKARKYHACESSQKNLNRYRTRDWQRDRDWKKWNNKCWLL